MTFSGELMDTIRAIAMTIPVGHVTSYGQTGRMVGLNPRPAGRAVAQLDDDVPWWRIVYADGTPATCHGGNARVLLEAEGVPFRSGRVDMAKVPAAEKL